METLEKYQKLKVKYEKLKAKSKFMSRMIESDNKHITSLEAEILDINTSTMNNIIENNKRFNLN